MQRGTRRRRSSASDEQQPQRVRQKLDHEMGPPLTTNGHVGPSAPPETSPTNGHTFPLDQVVPVKPPSDLMYEDDRGWAARGETIVEEDPATRAGRTPSGRRMPVDREEVVRLCMQGLRDMGYHQSADVLQAESGFTLSSRAVGDFEAAILGGRWSEALALLPELGVPTSAPTATVGPSEPASSGSSIASGKTKATGKPTPSDSARFLIAQQKYLEYLEAGQQKKALGVLRNELATVAFDSEVLHDLSGYMMCLDRDDLMERAQWDGAAGVSRRILLERLGDFISPKVMVPPRRLATLFEQARRYQQQSCVYHDEVEASSLYVDHACTSGGFPSVTTHILADHTDEIWWIEWSPDGLMLASAGKDKTVVIWQLKETPKEGGGVQYSVIPLHHLKGHRQPIDALAWSPDGQTLVTASDKTLYIWDTTTGDLKPGHVGEGQHVDTIGAIKWMPDGSEFVVASLDCKMVFYDAMGHVTRSWKFDAVQPRDFVIMPDGQRLVAITTSLRRMSVGDKLKPSASARVGEIDTEANVHWESEGIKYGQMEHGVAVIKIATREVLDYAGNLECNVTSLRLSHDGNSILVSCAPDEVQLLGLTPELHLIRTFKGHVQDRFLIRSCFGAARDRFVLSGSEDGHVYVWQRTLSDPVQVLSGHTDTVNAVAWNPVPTRRLFASCSDDATVRIWQPQSQGANTASEQVTVEGSMDADLAGDEDADGAGEDEEGMVL